MTRVERADTPNYTPGRKGHVPRGIVIHTTDATLAATLQWFANPDSHVSAHYVVGWDGSVYQLVDEADTARHAGRVVDPSTPLVTDGDPNLYTVGIEFEDRGDPWSGKRPAQQYAVGALLVRDIAARWGIPLDRNHVVGHREIRANKECPGDIDLERLIREARAARRSVGFICLLPVRNGEQLLPGYFTCVASFADAVVALDDGSTDRTREILEAEPLVKTVLHNPPRGSYEVWNDAANRNRLLEAARDLDPHWILSLDADERIDPGDAAALRAFVERDAVDGFAYGFRVHRMIGDQEHFDRAGLWAYRLFAYEAGHRFSDERLHLVPIPVSIPQTRWLKTTIRIQHLAGLTEEGRKARFVKYEEADPTLAFQSDYSGILEAPGEVRRWEPRPPALPVLLKDAESGALAELDLDAPLLSVIVIAQNDERSIEKSLRAVVDQDCPEAFEVIVVTSGTDRTAAIVRESFPDVTLVELPEAVFPGRARNAGLRIARGDYVSFPGSHVELPQGSLAARLRAHHRGYAMVSGATLNGTPTRSGWASYFLDHCGSLPGRPSGLLDVPPAHCSYLRSLLLEVGGFPEDLRAGEDTMVNLGLWNRGYNAYRAQDVRLVHRSPCRNPWRLMSHHFVRGRSLGRILLHQLGAGRGGLLWRRPLRRYVRRRFRLTKRLVRRWGGELEPTYRAAQPLVVLGIVAAAFGAWFEILRPGRGKATALFARRRRRSSEPEDPGLAASPKAGHTASRDGAQGGSGRAQR